MAKRWLVVFGAIALSVALAAGWWLSRSVPPIIISAQQCDLAQTSCTAQRDGQSITLTLAPQPIPILKPITLTVTLAGFKPEQLLFSLEGVNMFMGYQRAVLTPNADGTWQGTVQIPSCQEHDMQWKAVVVAPQGRSALQAEFKLTTHH